MTYAVIWLSDIRDISENVLECLIDHLSISEQERYHRFRRPQRRYQYLVGHILVRHAISIFAAVPFDDIVLVDQSNGLPPTILKTRLANQVFFSLSHSQNWVACAVSHSPIGLDIEYINPCRKFTDIASMAFSADEQQWLSQQPQTEYKLAFYQLWCQKEAVYKLHSLSKLSLEAFLRSSLKLSSSLCCRPVRFEQHPELVGTIASVTSLLDIQYQYQTVDMLI